MVSDDARRSLSPRQRDILLLIEDCLRRRGLPPTRADLARALKLRNRQGIDQHLRALERKGCIALEPGVARGIRVLAPAAQRPALPSRPALLPLYGRVAAGAPLLADSNLEDELAIDGTLFHPPAHFLLRVHGESMRDADIRDRDILAVHRTSQAINGQIVVARLGDEATVKYYRREGARLRLEPANPQFAPLQIDLRREDCQIEGVVVGLVRFGLPRAVASRRLPPRPGLPRRP